MVCAMSMSLWVWCSGLSALVVEGVTDEASVIRVFGAEPGRSGAVPGVRAPDGAGAWLPRAGGRGRAGGRTAGRGVSAGRPPGCPCSAARGRPSVSRFRRRGALPASRQPPGRPTQLLIQDCAARSLAEVRSHAACWAPAVNPAPARGRARAAPASAGRGSTICSTKASACSNAPATTIVLNTVKRYAHEGGNQRPLQPRYKPTLVVPYRDHLRARRVRAPAAPVLQLFREIEELGYTGSLNLLYRYITQGAPRASSRSPPRSVSPASCSPAPTTCATSTPHYYGYSPKPAPS